jgi:hypothetical protein
MGDEVAFDNISGTRDTIERAVHGPHPTDLMMKDGHRIWDCQNPGKQTTRMDHGTLFLCQLRSCGDSSQYQDVSYLKEFPEIQKANSFSV